MTTATFQIWRGGESGGALKDFTTSVTEGMVVLDAVHKIQAEQANDLAVRWNCKAGKCGSCSAEVNGNPRLMCMTRLNEIDLTKPVTIEPMRAFPPLKDLVTDVSGNFRAKQRIRKFTPRPPDASDGTWRAQQIDVERAQEFRKCIECFLCQDVCHVLRDHQMFDAFVGPRHLVYAAALEMNPFDAADRTLDLKSQHGIGYCNITKCCTKVCPESITITDNAIIPLKERVIDRLYDPVAKLLRVFPERCVEVKEVFMEFEIKTLSPEAVPRALAKAERYRLLNEPGEAESICLDALDVEPNNQEALAMLLLALTDQFGDEDSNAVAEAWKTVARLRDRYEQAYYTGILYERRAKAQLALRTPGSGPRTYEWLREAMGWYERAEAIRPPTNDDAILRWNACARLIMRDRHLVPVVEERAEPVLLE